MVLAPVMAVAALEPMDDRAMADVAGQDGLSLDISGDQLDAQGLAWQTDTDTARESNFVHQNATLTGVDASGNTSNGYTIAQTLDAGSDGTQPFLGYTLNMNDVRLSVDDMQMNRDLSNLSTTNPSPRSFGAFAIDAQQARIGFTNTGILDSGSSSASLLGEIVDGKVWYRQLGQNDPYLLLNNLQAQWQMNNATIGAVGSGSALDPFGMGGGLVQDADRIDVELQADWRYGASDSGFSITGKEVPVFRFGWSGAFKDATLIWRGAGGWSGDNWDAPSEGLTFSSRWNYITNDEATAAGEPESEFRWIFGESGGGVQIELSDWKPLGNNTYGHRFPLIAVDALNAGDGPGGLCFGSPNPGPLTPGATGCSSGDDAFVNLEAGTLAAFDRDTYDGTGTPGAGGVKTDAPSLAAFVRDGNLLTISNKVKLRQNGSQIDQFNWGLIFTLANVDGDMYLYPGGNPGDDTLLGGAGSSLDRGFMIDLVLMSQTFDENDSTTQGFNWDQGTHFMLADTEFETDGAGIGFLSSNVLLGANDARFWIKPTPANPSGDDYYEGGLDILAPQARWAFRGIFGGGSLPDGSEVVQGSFLEANLEGLANLRLSPSDPAATIADDGGSNFLGYSLALRLGDLTDPDFNMAGGTLGSGQGSFISAAEPARQDVKVTFGDITGDIALTKGVMDLRGPDEEEPGSRPALVISNEILIGQTAEARMTDAVTGHELPGSAAAGQPLEINEVSFSGDTLGRMAVPSGHWGSSVKFKPQMNP